MDILKYVCMLSLTAAGLLAGWWRCVEDTLPKPRGNRWYHHARAWLSHINWRGRTLFVLTVLVFVFDSLDKRDFDSRMNNLASASSEIRDVSNSSLTKISAASDELSTQTTRMQRVVDTLASQQIMLAQTALRGISTQALSGQQAAYDGMNQLNAAIFTYLEGRLDAQMREVNLVTGAQDETTYQRDALELATYTAQLVAGLLELAKKMSVPAEDKALSDLSKLLALAKEVETELKAPQQKGFVYQRLRLLRATLIQSRYNATMLLVSSHQARTKELTDRLEVFQKQLQLVPTKEE
jgi:hypothetical protein